MAAVDLLMAHRAVLVARRPEVMESRRHYARGRPGADRGRQIGMTLQADLLHHRPRQHAWIGRPVRFVARGAAFKTHRGVLEGEWTALVAMALEAARLVVG